MPIDIESFEATPGSDLRTHADEPTYADQVLSFLSERADQAFTLREVREALELPRGSMGTTLVRLEDRGQVRHRGEYWAIVPDTDATGDQELPARNW